MSINYFVTGTDTNVGKTYVSVCLLHAFRQAGFSTLGIKPIASGGDDAKQLSLASSIQLPFSQINPIAFDLPIAPHIAAKKLGIQLSVDELMTKTQPALTYPADVRILEGAGGLLVPLNDSETMADFVARSQLKIILVIGIRLGCINHALLSVDAIEKYALPFAGWIANQVEEKVDELEEMILTLQKWIHAPYLGRINYGARKLVSPDEKDRNVPSSNFISKWPC
jgi:dethiobiotin synthetase